MLPLAACCFSEFSYHLQFVRIQDQHHGHLESSKFRGVGRWESLPLTQCYSLPVRAIPNSLARSLAITYLILDPDKGNLTDRKAGL